MSFLPLLSDDEFSPEATAAATAFQLKHPGPISNLDRTLLGSAPIFDAYLGWFEVRDEVVPYLGERAVDLFALSISRGYGAPNPVAFFSTQLRANGDDPDDPQVTEVEGLLLEWGAQIGTDPLRVSTELSARIEQAFQPRVRLALTAFAGLMVAVCLFTVVGEIPEQ